MYVQNERVCHGVSYRFWAKMWHPEEPPPTSFRSPKKYVGGVYFTWSGEIFLRNFLPYPPKYSRVKGGGILAPCGVQDCYIVIQTIQSTFMRGAGSAVLLFCHRPNWVQEISVALFGVHDLCCPRPPLWARARGMVEPAVAIFSLSSQQ